MNTVATYFASAKKELTKITWPNKDKVVETSLIVLGCSALFAIYCYVVDLGIAYAFDALLYK